MKRVSLSGKMWEIRHWLKVYSSKYEYVSEWIDSLESNSNVNKTKDKGAVIYSFPKNHTEK